MEINARGEVVNHDIFDSVIHSDYRMTYDAVNQIITEKGQKSVTHMKPSHLCSI